MNCQFGSVESKCNITFEEGIQLGGRYKSGGSYYSGYFKFNNSPNFNGQVTLPQTINSNSSSSIFDYGFNVSNFFEHDTSYNRPFNFPEYIGGSCGCMFYDCENFNQPVTIPDNVTYCGAMFKNCNNLNSDVVLGNNVIYGNNIFNGLPNFNGHVTLGQNVTYCGFAFSHCLKFNQTIEFPNSVAFCDSMFYHCIRLNSPMVINSKYLDYGQMFFECYLLNKPITFGNTETVEVGSDITGYGKYVRFDSMFYQCTYFNQTFEISRNIDYTSSPNIVNARFLFDHMFQNCISMDSDVDISIHGNFGSKIIPSLSLAGMFQDSNTFNGHVNLNFSCISSSSDDGYRSIALQHMFWNCRNFNTRFDFNGIFSFCDKVDSISAASMFHNCDKFNQPIYIPEADFNADELNSSMLQLTSMLMGCKEFDSSITFGFSDIDANLYMTYICHNCIKFNQPINFPSGNIDMESAFSGCTSFNQSINIPSGNTNMRGAFSGCTSLNGTITIGNVNDCAGAFSGCTSLNSPVTVGSAESCASMVYGCTSLNSPVTVGSAKNCASMFSGCTKFNQPFTIPSDAINCKMMFNYCNQFSQDVYVPDSVLDFGYMLQGCNNFKGTVSLPRNNYGESNHHRVGLWASENTLGATVVWRDTGESSTVIEKIDPYYNSVYYAWSEL